MNVGQPGSADELAAAYAWRLLLAVRGIARAAETMPDSVSLDDADASPKLVLDPTAPGGWRCAWATTPEAAQILDLCLPLALGSRTRPVVLAHLGQSLDGRIATESGDSYYITGEENITHLHRLRALCDAVIVGAGTVSSDNPRLTTRHVPGGSPVRVVIDPQLRLESDYTLFGDGEAPSRIVCRADAVRRAEDLPEQLKLLPIETENNDLSPGTIVSRLHEEGLFALFLEGGGKTVSRFLAAGCLDRLHIAVAPLILGSGIAAIQLPAISSLNGALRLNCRSYPMGKDILFDCDLRNRSADS